MHFNQRGMKKLIKKYVFSCLGILFFLLFLFAKEDNPLKVEASVSPKRLSRGQEGKITLKISVEEGITIIPQPSFMIEFRPSEEVIFPKNFFTASDLEVETLEEDGEEYLNLKKPIEIPFYINLKAERGNHVLKGKIKYFANCKEEGWCLKSSTKFSASFYTRRTVVRKKK